MRVFTFMSGVFLLLAGWSGQARADLLVVSIDSSQVLRYDENTGAFLGVFATGRPNDHPVGMAAGGDGHLYVSITNFGPSFESAILRFDGRTGALIDTFASGGGIQGPQHLTFGPDGNLYVASFGGLGPNSKIIRYDGMTGAYIDDFVPVGRGGLNGAEGLVFGPDGNLYVTSRVSNQVLRYDGSTGKFLGVFATGGQNGPVNLVFGPDGNLYVLNGNGSSEVLRFDGSTGKLIDVFVREVPGSGDGSSLAFGPDGNLYVTTAFLGNSVLRFHGSTGQLIDTFVPSGSGGLHHAAGLLFFTPSAPKLVSIDIRPGSSPNNINPRSQGVIPLAILTTETFDAGTVDPLSVRLGPNGATEARERGHSEDADGDGDLDLVLHFRIRETGIQCRDTSVSLTGKTLDEQRIEGADSIRTVGCK